MGAAPILTILRDGETVKSLPIEGEAVLGRGEGCVIRLEDRAISRQHAVFRRTADGVQLEKKSEFGPIILNGAECTSAIIKDGDVINIGPYLLKFSMSKEAGRELSATAPVAFEMPLETAAAAPVMPESDFSGIQPFPTESVPEPVSSEPAVAAPEPTGGLSEIKLDVETSPEGEQKIELEGALASIAIDSTTAPVGDEGLRIETATNPSMVDNDGATKVASPGKLAVQLVFPEGAANHTTFELTKDEISIGRGKNCDIVLNDKRSSRKNAIIRRAGANFVIKDLDSANGTFVNGVRITEQELSGSDKIRIGEVEFEFKAMNADYALREANFLKVPDEPPAEEVPDFEIQLPSPVQGDIPVLPGGAGVPVSPAAPALDTGGGAPPLGLDIAGIPGLGVPGAGKSGKTSLIEKYKSLPPARKAIWAVIVLGLFYFLFLDEDPKPVKKPPAKKPVATQKGAPANSGVKTFESLTPEQQRFVEAQHLLAFDLYTKKDFDGALYEIKKITDLGITDYKNLPELKRYAEEGKSRMEQMKKEAEAKETEKRNKARVAALLDELRELMGKKNYQLARDRFAEVLSLDPDNAQISAWKKELDEAEERRRMEEQQAQVQKEINSRAWEFVKEAKVLRNKGKYYPAIEMAGKVRDVGASEKAVLAAAEKVIAQCRYALKEKREPLLAEAKQQEDAGEFAKAYQLYKQAIQVDPRHPAAFAGIGRIQGILHDRAKVMYAEAVLAESYSDFSTAKKKFQECLTTAPDDDTYHQRAQRKLARYFKKDDL